MRFPYFGHRTPAFLLSRAHVFRSHSPLRSLKGRQQTRRPGLDVCPRCWFEEKHVPLCSVLRSEQCPRGTLTGRLMFLKRALGAEHICMATGARQSREREEKDVRGSRTCFEVEEKTQTEHDSQSRSFWRKIEEYVGQWGAWTCLRGNYTGGRRALSTCCAEVCICASSKPAGLHYIYSALSPIRSNRDYNRSKKLS
jgi:hypothetical protein